MNQDSEDVTSSLNTDLFLKQILGEPINPSNSLFTSDFVNSNPKNSFAGLSNSYQQSVNSRYHATNKPNKYNNSFNKYPGPSQSPSYTSFGYQANNSFGQFQSSFPNSFNNYGSQTFNYKNNVSGIMSNEWRLSPTDANHRNSYSNNRKEYVKSNKAQNIHRLWPHTENKTNNSRPKINKLVKKKEETSTKKPEDVEKESEKKTETIEINENEGQSSESETVKAETPKPNSDESKTVKSTVESNVEESDKTQANVKTGMCLINELVKINKIKHEYILLDEIGPAHKKTFYVQLKLGIGSEAGEEVYVANGTSIKKAQQNASDIAYKDTKFKKPGLSTRDKSSKDLESNGKTNSMKSAEANANRKQLSLAPTVMLNALAMKLELKPSYTPLVTAPAKQHDHYRNFNYNNTYQPAYVPPPNKTPYAYNNYTNFTSNRYKPFVYQPLATHFAPANLYTAPVDTNFRPPWGGKDFKGLNRAQRAPGPNTTTIFSNDRQDVALPQKCVVKLKFAEQEFEGEGVTMQAARHNAATKALDHFSKIENFNKAKELAEQQKSKKGESSPPSDMTASAKTNSPVSPNSSEAADNVSKKSKEVQEVFAKISPEPVDSKTTELKEKPKITILARRQSNEDNNKAVTESKKEQLIPLVSEINVLNDYVNILKKNVKYELVQESGPSHSKRFITRCLVDTKKEEPHQSASQSSSFLQNTVMPKITANAPTTFETIGEGNSKKVSKLNAAIAMLKIIKDHFEPIILMHQPLHRQQANPRAVKKKSTAQVKNLADAASTIADVDGEKKRNKASNIDKIKKTTPEYGKGTINAISRLIQIQQAKQDPEPVFEFVSSSTTNQRYRGGNFFSSDQGHFSHFNHKRHEFVFQCIVKTKRKQVNGSEAESTEQWEILKSEGKATTKKNAKKNAAEAMLIKIGYQPGLATTPISLKPALKTTSSSQQTAKQSLAIVKPREISEIFDNVVEVSDEQGQSRPESSSSPSSSDGDKGEKHVKFSAELNELNDDKSRPKRISKNGIKPQKKANQNADEHQKINIFKEKLLEKNKLQDSTEQVMFDARDMINAFKIARELLESIDQPIEGVEFSSETAKRLLEDQREELLASGDYNNAEKPPPKLPIEFNNNYDKEGDLDSSRLLTGNIINYKRVLDYLANVLRFKVAYQCLLSRDGRVNSYVSLPILSNAEKSISGQGSTVHESSNVAAHNALKYLSSQKV